MGVWYATRESVMRALDSKLTARNAGQIDEALEAASRDVESLCHRVFYPEIDTRYFDWPDSQYGTPWRLWLDDSELISLTSLSSGGVAIDLADVLLEPNRSGPPYNRIELNTGTSAAFGGGSTHQRDVAAVGLWAGCALAESTVGALTAAVATTTATTVTVNGAASARLGVGSVVRVDSERMLVTGRSMADTGQNLAADIDQQIKTVIIPVASGAAFAADEVILIDGERMLIVDIAGNTLIVKRAWDGSANAAHASGADIYAPRTLTVERGALGTTAATHIDAAPAVRWDPPGPVNLLTIAETINTLNMQQSAYSKVFRSGESGGSERARDQKGIERLRSQVYDSHARKGRVRAV
ncbi:hypothetical protein [Streptomyces chartreusis]|uniref:hypothetical protein n=1 Tax=Streptomyces chartreusis TaxID=1969 RepID=UPI0035DDA723